MSDNTTNILRLFQRRLIALISVGFLLLIIRKRGNLDSSPAIGPTIPTVFEKIIRDLRGESLRVTHQS